MLHKIMLFLFFKQKTAYEMRISDWSSDVCSSDLTAEDEELHAGPYEEAVFGDPLDLFTEGIGRKGRRAVDQAVFCLDNSYGDHRDRNDEAEEVEKKDKHPTSLSSARRQIRRASLGNAHV